VALGEQRWLAVVDVVPEPAALADVRFTHRGNSAPWTAAEPSDIACCVIVDAID
jgi:hypothetical protein